MVSASIPSTNGPAKGLILVLTVMLNLMIKVQITGRMVSSGISDIAFASVYSEKTHLNKLMIIMNISQDTMVFSRRQKLTSAMKLRPQK